MTLATNLMMQFFMQQQEHGPRLPAAYQEAEYLWTDRSGTYIDTGLKITTDDVIECTALYSTDIATTTNAAFIGDGNSKTDSNFAIWLAPDSTTSAAYNVEFSFGDGSSNTYKVIVPKHTIDVSQWHTYKTNAGTGEAWVDGEYKGKAPAVKGYANAKKLVLFGSWRNNTTNSLFTGRMGECRIWRSGELIRHFVPAFWENQKVTGFYDMCTERLYMGATRSSIRLGPCPLDERADLAMEVMPTADKLTLSFNKLEFINSGVQYVDWGDGNVELTTGGDEVAHTYAQPGTYVVRLQSLPACTFIQCRGMAATRILRLDRSVIPYNMFYDCTDVTMADNVLEDGKCVQLETQAFRNASSLALTRLPRTLQAIYGMAFQWTAVSISTIPAFVAHISGGAFGNCANIRTMTFESKPVTIEDGAFATASLTDIYVPWRVSEMPNVDWGTSSATVHYRSNIPPNDEVWYYAPNKLTLYTDTGVTSHTFSNGKGVLKFASNVTTCEPWFRGINLNMLAVVLPNTVTAIADQAFYDTPGMTWVGMPDGVTRIGEEAFRNCMSLHLTTLPTSLTEIASYAFHTCSNITFTSLPTGLTTIYKSTFRGCTKLAISAVPSGVTVVQENSFQSCTTITQMEFPANLDKLHTDVFRYCSGLTSATFLGTPSFIHNNAFRGCDNLTDIYVPWSSTDAINADAPWGATNATMHYGVSTPPNDEIWYWAPAQTTLYDSTDVVSHTFSGGKGVLKFAADVVTTGQWLRECTDVELVMLPDTVTTIGANSFQDCTSLWKIGLPEGLTSLGANSFDGCTALDIRTLPSTVQTVGSWCFRSRAMSEFTLPAAVTSVGYQAFHQCTAAKAFTFAGTPTTLGGSLFAGCGSLTDIYVPWDSTDPINANAPWGATNAVLHYNQTT